jgi:hypothetical protein
MAPASAAAAGGCQTAGTESNIVVELPGAAAGLLRDALAGSNAVRLEIDLVLHGAVHSKAAADSSAAAAAAAGTVPVGAGQQGARGKARTPSGRVVRRTGSDAGTPLSPSGKEVWAKVSLLVVDQQALRLAGSNSTFSMAGPQLRHTGKHNVGLCFKHT